MGSSGVSRLDFAVGVGYKTPESGLRFGLDTSIGGTDEAVQARGDRRGGRGARRRRCDGEGRGRGAQRTGADQGRHRLLTHGAARELRRAVHPGPSVRPLVRDEGHQRGQRTEDRAHHGRRRGRPGEGRLGGEGPDRQGLQDPRRQRLVGRRPSGRSARRAEQDPVHLRPGGEATRSPGSTSTRSAPAGRAIRTCSRRARISARAVGRPSPCSPRIPRSGSATTSPSTR